MPRRTDIQRILLIGAGPIVIGQACEFDYSGTQGAKALREEGYDVVLVNSNPATIMTDPELAARTYVEPLEWRTLAAIIERERPAGDPADARRADGAEPRARAARRGRARALRRRDARRAARLDREGRGPRALQGGDGEDRPRRARAPASRTRSRRRAPIVRDTGFPAILRPSFTLGGSGGGIAYTPRRVRREGRVGARAVADPRGASSRRASSAGRSSSSRSCATGPTTSSSSARSRTSIRWACTPATRSPSRPAMTLTDREYQRLRDAARAVMTEIGVETGGSNVQFSVDPKTGRVPRHRDEPARVARARRSRRKATGYPDREDRREARRRLHARRAEERHHRHERRVRAGHRLRRREVAALRVREVPRRRHDARHADEERRRGDEHRAHVLRGAAEGGALARDRRRTASCRSSGASTTAPSPSRSSSATSSMEAPELEPPKTLPPRDRRRDACARSRSSSRRPPPTASSTWPTRCAPASPTTSSTRCTAIDPWFLAQIRAHRRRRSRRSRAARPGPTSSARAKRLGFSDRQIATLAGRQRGRRARAAPVAGHTRRLRARRHVRRRVRRAHAVPLLDVRDRERGAPGSEASRKVIILGGGPNRIGQGIEFDYCCVHAVHGAARARASRPSWSTATRRRCRPTTTRPTACTSSRSRSRTCSPSSTRRSPRASSCSSAGRRRSSSRCRSRSAGVQLLGTSADAIDRAEDRGRFDELAHEARPEAAAQRHRARRPSEAHRASPTSIGYPVLVRPSYVLGGRAMMIAYTRERARALRRRSPFEAAREAGTQTILVDEFLKDAIEVDVDCVCRRQARASSAA